jgi:hypothetical protein
LEKEDKMEEFEKEEEEKMEEEEERRKKKRDYSIALGHH